MTYSMLVASAACISVIAVLGGFEALSRAFLDESAVVFEAIATACAMVAPLFVWFPHWDLVQRFGAPRYAGPPQSTKEAEKLIVGLWLLGTVAAAIGAGLHFASIPGEPKHWEYLVLAFSGLLYTAAMTAIALWVATREAGLGPRRGRLGRSRRSSRR